MERYVAVDDVCAWPNLTRLLDGGIAALIFNQPTHGQWEGDVECWVSRDEGRLWHRAGVAAPHEPGTNRMNLAAGLAGDGALVALVSGYDRRPPRGQAGDFAGTTVLPLWVCRSQDGGATWERGGGVGLPPGRTAQPYGVKQRLPGGGKALLCPGWEGDRAWPRSAGWRRHGQPSLGR
ncbi:MAG: hypothetical protein AB1505_29130, partial [Candidatus Latescibacterota bacterium]